jgi:diphthine methyl ester acylhydrolase
MDFSDRANRLSSVKIQTLSTASAVLDLHFSPHSPTTFAIATSAGAISIYTLSTTTPSPVITHDHTAKLFGASTLVLALAFHPTDPSLIAGSLSTGSIALTNPSANTVLHLLPTHSLEAWTLVFSSTTEELYSGGDDCALAQFYIGPAGKSAPTKSWSDSRSHAAGVTAILPYPLDEQILLTGSYDEFVRIYDCGIRRVLAKKKVAEGGGVWRLRPICSRGNGQNRCLVLASCMHSGSRVLEIVRKEGQDGDWEIRVLGAFEEHQSMNYASDVGPYRDGGGLVIVSTSFYDCLLCVWIFDESS